MSGLWMITNRAKKGKNLTGRKAGLAYYASSADGPEDLDGGWTAVTPAEFRRRLIDKVSTFPVVEEELHREQKHISLLIHGYNVDWTEAVNMYKNFSAELYSGEESLGELILFTWPSDGSKLGYYPDREDARASATDLAEVFNALGDMAVAMQKSAVEKNIPCKAKVSVVAHSMGNYVLERALFYSWQRQNKPLLLSLINQCLMVAADVDNDIFKDGENVSDGAGEGIANLCYRISALFTGRDDILGMSAGLKHFGKRRLGRSGLDRNLPVPDNVWDLDCSELIPEKEDRVHGAYFRVPKTLEVMRLILKGLDRKEILKVLDLPV